MTTALIACGALAREVLAIKEKRNWDADVLSDFGEQSLAELLTEVFRGRQPLFVVGGFVANLVFFVFGIFAVINFLQAPEVRDMVVWGAAAGFCFAVVATIKIWYWLEMMRHALVRDIKRVELQIAQLAQRL